MKHIKIGQTISFLLLAIPLSSALAAGGAMEINQACVADGCFPGDAPGFPVNITAPGLYFLSSNIEVSSLSESAIRVDTGVKNVTLDLAGFQVLGPNMCQGAPLQCDSGSGNGIVAREGNVVKNGSVRGFGQWGVAVGASSKVFDVTTENNGSYGFVLGDGTIARDLFAYRNDAGFSTGRGVILDSIVATNNRSFGVALNGTPTDGGSTVRNCSLTLNGTGIYDWGSSLIENCLINRNGEGVTSGNGGTRLSNSQVLHNVRPVRNVGGVNLSDPPAPMIIKDSTLFRNELGFQNFAPGVILLIGSTVCDDPLCS